VKADQSVLLWDIDLKLRHADRGLPLLPIKKKLLLVWRGLGVTPLVEAVPATIHDLKKLRPRCNISCFQATYVHQPQAI
jgi:hypothetical protein